MLTYPFCHGEPGRRHVLEPMRVEQPRDGAIAYLRCPVCHRTADLFEHEPIESTLATEDRVAVLINGESAVRLEEWQGPFTIRVVPTDRPRVMEMQVRRNA